MSTLAPGGQREAGAGATGRGSGAGAGDGERPRSHQAFLAHGGTQKLSARGSGPWTCPAGMWGGHIGVEKRTGNKWVL